MAVLLAVASSLCYGFGDFAGGVAARRAHPLRTTLYAELAGCPLALGVLLATPPAHMNAGAVGWSAGAGVCGAVGLVMFFTALRRGAMAVGAPLAAVCTALVPVAVGIASGERPSIVQATGVVVAVIAVVLLSVDTAKGRAQAGRLPAWLAVGAGVFFGAYLVCYARVDVAAGAAAPVLIARLTSVLCLGAAMCVAPAARRGVVPRRTTQIAGLSGCLDVVGNLFYVTAVRNGLLSLIAVVTSLYPAVTVLLAALVLGERLRRVQQVGCALAVTGVVLIAW